MTEPSGIIQAFWYGSALSIMERLSLASFVASGHTVHLYAYRELDDVPDGVELRAADTILAETEIFVPRAGSIGIFADWFRLELLYRFGGFWVDLDVVCLRRFDFESTAVFGLEDERTVSNAVLRLPAGHALLRELADQVQSPNRLLQGDDSLLAMKKLARRFLLGNRRHAQGWGEAAGPPAMTRALKRYGLFELALPPHVFYPIHYDDWRWIYDPDSSLAEGRIRDSHAVHLWNEMARREPSFDKNAAFPTGSMYERWKRRFL